MKLTTQQIGFCPRAFVVLRSSAKGAVYTQPARFGGPPQNKVGRGCSEGWGNGCLESSSFDAILVWMLGPGIRQVGCLDGSLDEMLEPVLFVGLRAGIIQTSTFPSL